jgi:hypothetical protein
MDAKKKAGVAVVSEAAAQAALRRGATRELDPQEEKVMRMRLGASPARTAPLEQAGRGLSDLEIELLSYEIEAWMKMKARRAEGATARLAPVPSRTKEKIVRALRRKT